MFLALKNGIVIDDGWIVLEFKNDVGYGGELGLEIGGLILCLMHDRT